MISLFDSSDMWTLQPCELVPDRQAGSQHSTRSPGDGESGCIRHEFGLGGIQVMILFDQRAEGGDGLREQALLHPLHVQVVV